ncbi:TIGR01440 family protein [Paenibacillus larvae]
MVVQKETTAIIAAVKKVLTELIEAGGLRKGQVVVFGVSTSEVMGKHIGTAGTLDAAKQIYTGASEVARQYGLHLAFQCCEHLNRALVIEEDVAERYGLDPVSVVPVPKAGGSMAAYAYRQMKRPCVVEQIKAHAGIDIGDTLIGMHLRPVAVPVRPSIRLIGEAHVTMAYTRPKLVGGARAVYTIGDETCLG